MADETLVKFLHFNTNAMLLTEGRCRELAGSGVTQINVSIDGRGPQENDRLRRGASYAMILENVRMLLVHTRPAGIAVVIVNVQVRRPDDPETPQVPEFLRRGFCMLPFSDMVVRANGDVTLCCYDLLGAEVMGNVKDTTLPEIWNGPKCRALRTAMAEGRIDDIPDVCRRCPIYTGEELLRQEPDTAPVTGPAPPPARGTPEARG